MSTQAKALTWENLNKGALWPLRYETFHVFSEMTAEEKELYGTPQFQVGEKVTVNNPWWMRDRDGRQIKDKVLCEVVAAHGHWFDDRKVWPGRMNYGRYGLDVKPISAFAHGRSVYETDIEGFTPRPSTMPTATPVQRPAAPVTTR
jgi:hypothetical protein